MAFTGVAALIGAIGTDTAITAGMVLSAVGEVGTAMTVVGAVTGNKDLTRVGGVMGAVGGIGGMVAGGMSSAASGVAAADVGAEPAMLEANPTDMRLAAGTQESPGIVGGAQDAAAAGDMPGVSGTISAARSPEAFGGLNAPDPSAGMDAGTGLPPMSSTDVSSSPVSSVDITGGAPASGTPAMSTAMNPGEATPVTPGTVPPGLTTGTQGAAMPSSAPQDTTSFMNRMMQFMRDPKNRTMVQMGEKLVGGAFQGMQQESQFKQRMDLERKRLAQTSYGSQVAGNAPRGGIVNGAR